MTIRFPAGGIGWVWTGALVMFSLGTFSSRGTAQDGVSPRKMLKQIGVMEQILDQVLIDSPNFLVPGRGNARGIFIEEFGVLLTFEASLVEKDWGNWGDWSDGFKFETDDKGNRVVIIPDSDSDDEDKGDEKEDRKSIRDRKSTRDRNSHRRPSEERLYESGKIEIEDMLLDYAGTLTTLADGSSIAIAAFLKDSDYFMDQRISRLVIRARMKDLRDWDAGRISEEKMRERFVKEEY